MPGLLETLEGIRYKHEAHEKPVEEVYLGPFRACPFVLQLNACSFQRTRSDSLSKYPDMAETSLDLASLDTHTYTIKPDCDEGLQRLAAKLMEVGSVLRYKLLMTMRIIHKARDGLDAEHRAVAKDLGLAIDKKLHLEDPATYGYCFRLTKNVCYPTLFINDADAHSLAWRARMQKPS